MTADNWRLIWSPDAQDDLDIIWDHYSQMVSLEAADKLVREIKRAADRAADNPLLWQVRHDIVPGYLGGLRTILVHPYVVIFHLLENKLRIARVLHQRRDVSSLLADEERRPN
jgi:plasmid stabilization system protein ParE